ncbi:MAG: phenylacetic acid degradation protein PaaY [Ottowia sp.]|nr:phenylacetic acid degradation protein PaaY [Ottowia sp.]
MPCYAIDGVIPVVHPDAFVHPNAVLIGDVIVGADCYIGPNASLRGDFGGIQLMRGANVQDCCILHGFPDQLTIVEENGHIGHGAVLHGCHIQRDALVGMGAVVMDQVVVGERAIVAACAFVPAGMHIPEQTLVAGLPAKIKRVLTDEEVGWKQDGTRAYHALTRRSLRSMQMVEPLTQIEVNRPQLDVAAIEPLVTIKQRRS